MQAIFQDIIAGDLDGVRRRVAVDPGSVALVATDDVVQHSGHSTLMAALIAGQFAIADFLLDHGADTGYIDEPNRETYARPVLHDAITAAVFRTLPAPAIAAAPSDGASESFAFLVRLLEAGADVNVPDSQGNSSLFRAASDTWAVLQCAGLERQIDPALRADLLRIFTALVSHGGDPRRPEPHHGISVADIYRDHAIGRLLKHAVQASPMDHQAPALKM
ncbi:ankyrin repeat domain-containing protein [Arthrobacter woluwensis]|uniref:Uncharacterized protein n=1 Tax=Arthrobacter woluwensis TaxID=156980 RepID=A0A1H4SJ17_9MICC|nr:ankyrin repeat domain-containing protein [Arthrobacter woluwensis]SEC44068.1 hypothetical protein SAMN04489745_2876 [Arthrobacter woluwensis]